MKKIQEIDKNLDLKRNSSESTGLDYYDIPQSPFDLYGVYYDENEGFLRLPLERAKKVSDGVHYLANQTTGGRLRFSTDSSVIEIKVSYGFLWALPHMSISGQGGFILLEEREKDKKYVKVLPPTHKDREGYTANVKVPGGKMRDYILYFPLYNPVRSLSIGLEKGARVDHGKKYKDIKPILYYGSSITQGACASRPDNCYQGWIEKWNNVDYINLGFTGNGKGEDEMIDYIIEQDVSLFVSDFNHSGIPIDELEYRHPRMYERYRKARPDTPILILSKTNLWEGYDNAEREKIIRSTYENARANGDHNVYFVSGHDMFKGRDKQSLAVDGDHPNDHGFYLMARKIYKKMKEINEIFK